MCTKWCWTDDMHFSSNFQLTLPNHYFVTLVFQKFITSYRCHTGFTNCADFFLFFSFEPYNWGRGLKTTNGVYDKRCKKLVYVSIGTCIFIRRNFVYFILASNLRYNDIICSYLSQRMILLFFVFVSELNLSHNQISKLPDQLGEMKNLKVLNISYNSFVELPEPIARLQELTTLIANNNFIIGKYPSKHLCK